MLRILSYIIYVPLYTLIANSGVLISRDVRWPVLLLPLFILINAVAGRWTAGTKNKRLRTCNHGVTALTVFVISTALSVVYHAILIARAVPDFPAIIPWSILLCTLTEAVLFWNGIISVYLTSTQLGIKKRILGILLGMIPIANLAMLFTIVRTVSYEVTLESSKERLNRKRATDRVCQTKYPILMVHGVFFRDSEYFNYWGRIPAELEMNGAEIHYGEHQSAASVADSAAELADRIRSLTEELGCKKLNVIAHSKGGLDCRYAIANCGIAGYVASLTTVNTPHRGCGFADHLLHSIPEGVKNRVAKTYNSTLRKLGDETPDFIAAVSDLTEEYCTSFDSTTPASEDVFCQSVGSLLENAKGGRFPLNFSHDLVKHFDGPNDGLVSKDSFEWGERFTLLCPTKKRGISHGDVIDLNRENIYGFDVREFYVELVSDLKNRGY